MSTPVEQLSNELAKAAMNLSPAQRRTFYHAIHQASTNWLAAHPAPRLDALTREVLSA